MIYPEGTGADTRDKALREYRAALRDGALPSAIIEGARRYAAYTDATSRTGTQYVRHLSRWLRERCWQLAYDIPPPPATSGTQKTRNNINAMQSAVARIRGRKP